METIDKIIAESKEIPENYKYYWEYQYKLALESIVPYSISNKIFEKGNSVMEIGSAEGGVLAAFVQAGSGNAICTDIAQNRLDMGKTIAKITNLNIEFHYHDILNSKIPDEWKNKFDLIILRDVIEHLDNTYESLFKISPILKSGGFLLVTFPPYHSPFGGHQHTVGNKLGKLPYIHLLPNFIFQKLISSGRQNDIKEVKRLQKIRLTPKKFEKASTKSGFSIYKKDFYLLRPVFKMKFGLPAIKLTPISALPLIKSFFSLEATYILQKK